MDFEFEKKWNTTLQKIEKNLHEKLDLTSIIFMIGLQELGSFSDKFSKNKKVEVMHIGVCTILSQYGYYEFDGRDNDNWPHYILKKKLPNLNSQEQDRMLKEAVIDYLELEN